jgi:hypothetical protein
MRTPFAVKALILRRYLRQLARMGDPVVVGPFRSEVGFEQLYWIPFVTWALKYAGIPRDRCMALSRGGMGVFYPVASNADLYQVRGVDAVRIENQVDYAQRKLQKQTTVTDWDREVCREVGKAQWGHSARVRMLHPSWMYWLLEDVWEERAPVLSAAPFLQYDALPVPPLPEGMTLPDKFLAVRFYERATLPYTNETKGLIADLVQQVAAVQPVVLIRQSAHVDDHIDFPIAPSPRIAVLPETIPEQNLILQAAVLARCTAFVGTYGGVAQWALRYRKPTMSVYAQFGGTALAHWHLSQLLAAKVGVPFQVMDLRLLTLWNTSVLKAPEPAPAA